MTRGTMYEHPSMVELRRSHIFLVVKILPDALIKCGRWKNHQTTKRIRYHPKVATIERVCD